jgi:hypothetical protein
MNNKLECHDVDMGSKHRDGMITWQDEKSSAW